MGGLETTEQPAGKTCEICGETSAVRRELNDGYYAHFCTGCDFLWTDVDRGTSSLEEINKGQYEVKGRLLTYFLRQREFSCRYKKILGLLRRHVGGGMETMLEIGSNIGAFAGYASEHGIQVETIEIQDDLRAMQSILYKVPAYKSMADISEGRTYNVIVMMDVLEHIPGPVNYLSRLKHFVAADGIVFLQMPNKNSWVSRIAGKQWGWWSAPDHLYHFSARAIFRAAEKSGYQVIRLRHVSPVLDDLEGIPILGRIFSPVRILSRWMNPNPIVESRGGSLIQAVLKPQ